MHVFGNQKTCVFLNNSWVTNLFEWNSNKNMYQSLCNVVKVVFRKEFVDLNMFIKK